MSSRTDTRDLLIEYHLGLVPPRPLVDGETNTSVPLDPKSKEFKYIYPWDTETLVMLKQQLYSLAANSGYTGTFEEFHSSFGAYLENSKQEIVFDIYNHFPQVGDDQHLYFDTNDKILYYWDNAYIPIVNNLEHFILNCGDATNS